MVEIMEQDLAANQRYFAEIKQQLRTLLGDAVTIEHVGSTAVPGLIGKNIIDVLIGVAALSQTLAVAKQLIEAGWFVGRKQGEGYCFLASRAEETGAGDIHLHIAPSDSLRHRQFLQLRDFLCQRPDWRQRYNDFKQQIVSEISGDRQAYKQRKSQFVTEMLQEIAKIAKSS